MRKSIRHFLVASVITVMLLAGTFDLVFSSALSRIMENKQEFLADEDIMFNSAQLAKDSYSPFKEMESLESDDGFDTFAADLGLVGIGKSGDFAYIDEDSVELIIGVNHGQPDAYLNLVEEIDKSQSKVVNTVSIGGEIVAVVVDMPLNVISSFAETVQNNLARYIEPNMEVQAQLVPNDPNWGLQWGPQKIGADYAWNTTTGSFSILVAVVDTGIDYTHGDLVNNYVALGYDWVNNDNLPMDDHGHGTHCAGIIAAVLDNGIGIAGLAQVRVMAEKVLDSEGGGDWDDIANGIIHATNSGADIISMSLGGYAHSELLHEAVKYAYDSGVLVVAAAGNEDTNMKLYPAGYDEAVAVAATDKFDDRAVWSNYGDWIELAAPGVEIYSTVPWGYAYGDGTSMACPHVSGVAALAMSQYPNRTSDWFRMWLRHTIDDLGDSGFDIYYGHGRINARKAVEQSPLEHELVVSLWRTPPYVEPNSTGIINATILNFGENDENNVTVQLFANNTLVNSTVFGIIPSGETAEATLPWTPTIEGFYNITLYVVPLTNETDIENNMVQKYTYVGFPLKAVVLHSAGNLFSDILANWQVLNNEWYQFGDVMLHIDYTVLNKENITYGDIVATEADVLIISCAFDPFIGWEFTDSEIEAIEMYVREGHGLIVTAGTFYDMVPNNNKLAPIFGMNEATMWSTWGTDLLNLIETEHPIFRGVPNPFIIPMVTTAIPYDGQWDSNELIEGEYFALGQGEESAIVSFRGLVYISPWLEVIPSYYLHHLQLLYNAITWSHYQRPEHELEVSMQAPSYLEPGESVLLNATVSNMGLSNETDVELHLLINDIMVNNATISQFANGSSYTINYTWTPNLEAAYNITAYAPPVPNENLTINNIATQMVYVRTVIGHVVFEEAHLPSYTIGSNPAGDVPGGYSEFARHLSINGYMVSTIDPGTTIDSTVLAPADVLIIVAPANSYSLSELDAIEGWVKNGGNLLLVSDWIFFGEQARTIAERFNVIMKDDGMCDFDENAGYELAPYYDGANLLSHPVTVGVNRVEIYGGDGITSAPESEFPIIITDSDGTAYWYFEGSTALAVSVMSAFEGGVVGSGRLIVMTDSNIWDSANDADGDGSLDFYDSDNEILALNTVSWLSVRYEHDLAVSLEAPRLLQPSQTSMLNATVHNSGLNNEANVTIALLINGTQVANATFPLLLNGTSRTINYSWTPTVEGMYNITAYAPPVLDENITTNNIASWTAYVGYIEVALISDYSELRDVNPILDSMGINYDVYEDNYLYHYTEDLNLLLNYKAIIFYTGYRHITKTEHSTLESYLSSGGNLLVTGFDCLIGDDLLADLVRSSSIGDNVGEPDLLVVEETHPIMNGPYGSFPEGYHIYDLFGDCDMVEANTARDAMTVAELQDGYDRIIATEGLPGKVVFWNGVGTYDWSWNGDCEAMFKNLIHWFTIRYEHELAVFLEAPRFLEPGDSASLKATVRNQGLNNETNVELQLLIDATTVRNITITELAEGASYTMSYTWTPTLTGTYNITVYAPPVSGETNIENNVYSTLMPVQQALRILAYVQYTDYDDEYANTLRAIESAFGPSYILTEMSSQLQLESMLPGKDILLIPEQEYSSLYTMENTGAAWSETLSDFLENGGVIILCDYNGGSGGTYGILTGAGLMTISDANPRTWYTLYLVDPMDPLAEGVSSSFEAPDGTISFETVESKVVVDDSIYPVVIHKKVGLGHVALLGFDFLSSRKDAEQILGNAVALATSFTVTINPNAGSPGTQVTATGIKATPNDLVSIYWDNVFVGNTTTNNVGGFSYMLTVPSNTRAGIHEIIAVDRATGRTALTLFRVILIAPNLIEGSVGTKVTIDGSGFKPETQVTIKFNDMLTGHTETDSSGNFTFIFNVPFSNPGAQTIKALDAEGNYASATFDVIDVSPLDVQIDVGAMYFFGEIAEFYAQTTFKGRSVNASITNIVLYRPDETIENLTNLEKCVNTGLYKIPYTILGNETGTYTLVLTASYLTDVVRANGTSFKCFSVSNTLTLMDNQVKEIKNGVATIQTDIDLIRLNLTAMNATLENIFLGIRTINGTTATIQTTVGIMNGTIASIEDNMATIVIPGVGQIEADISSLRETQEAWILPQYVIIIIALVAAVSSTLSVIFLKRKTPTKAE